MHPPQIPLTPQTDPRNFPVWDAKAPPGHSGHPYPKMLTRRFTAEDRAEWLKSNAQWDQHLRQEYYLDRVPRIGDPYPVAATPALVDLGYSNRVGGEVICASAEDEKAVIRALDLEYKTAGQESPEWLRKMLDAAPQKAASSVSLSALLSASEETAAQSALDDTQATLEKLERDNKRLQEMLAEKQRLEKALEPEAKKKGGWPKGKPRAKQAPKEIADEGVGL